MAYSQIDPNFDKMNDADKNNAAIKAGYTGLSDYNNNKGSTQSSSIGSTSGTGNLTGAGSAYQANSDAITSSINSNKQSIMDLLKNQTSTEDDFMKRYQGAVAGQETLPAMQARIEGSLNLPALRQNALSLNQTLQNMPITQQTANRAYTLNSNQLQQLIAQKQYELAPAAGVASQNQGLAETQLGEQMQTGVAQQQKELTPYATEATMISDRAAREVTGYTTAMTDELNALTSKLTAGATLSAAEYARATTLLNTEATYKGELQKVAAGQKYFTIPQNSNFINTFTNSILNPTIANGNGATQL